MRNLTEEQQYNNNMNRMQQRAMNDLMRAQKRNESLTIKQMKQYERERNQLTREEEKLLKEYNKELEKNQKEQMRNVKTAEIRQEIAKMYGAHISMFQFNELTEEPKKWVHACKELGDLIEYKPQTVGYKKYKVSIGACPHCRTITYYAKDNNDVFGNYQ